MFVNAYKPVNDITVACGAGAIKPSASRSLPTTTTICGPS